MLVSQLQAIPGLVEHGSVLNTVLSELYSNALEHGVLGLSSTLKQGPSGFERYLDARERGLAKLRDGWVKISASCRQHDDGGELVVRVEDSGPGFDWQALKPVSAQQPNTCGLDLLRGLCAEVGFEGQGNRAFAVLRWGVPLAANDA
jgi:anti-sigma regulatory factor (Ser/Thr protein kinase)